MRRAGSAYAHRTGLARSLRLAMKRRSFRARSVIDVEIPREQVALTFADHSSTWLSQEAYVGL
jgi:hypothetical protein